MLARARRSRQTWLHSTKLKVAAGIAGGFMIGSVSLASAGALPGQAQDVAHAALGALGVHVPPGKDRYNGPECGDVRNHGEYVDAHPDDPNAGKSPCGKPMRSVNNPGHGGKGPAGAPDDAGRHGPPPWAGQGKGKDKDKKQDKPDSPESDKTSDTAGPTTTAPTVVAEPTTTAAEEPTATTAAEEPTTTTSDTSDSTTSTTTESTSTTTTAP